MALVFTPVYVVVTYLELTPTCLVLLFALTRESVYFFPFSQCLANQADIFHPCSVAVVSGESIADRC
ncbi:hypothetical protein D3C75_1201220 [compost metagenome]